MLPRTARPLLPLLLTLACASACGNASPVATADASPVATADASPVATATPATTTPSSPAVTAGPTTAPAATTSATTSAPPVRSGTPVATGSTGAGAASPTAWATPTDSAADQALSDLARERGADVVSLDPATPDQPALAALVTDEGTGATLELLHWERSGWVADATLPLPEPVLADREGGAVQWRHLTQDLWSDVVVYLQGGTLHSGVDAVVASHYGGRWSLVPREGVEEGEGSPVLLGNPLFDDGAVFVTRASAGGEVVLRYWRFDTTTGAWGQQPGPSAD
ncbi:hypothetical protein [Kineococcus sp. G2]|uniref:hypothetical protein n=1 Tax=Kineococcus sp. G2 TaxID=3127484 RepID=UPI00301DB045